MSIDASIDALGEALRAHGVDPPRPPSEPVDLEAVDAELAPMSLPAQVRRFWERVDPTSLRLWAYPEPVPPGFAIDGWRQRRDEFPGVAPRVLLDVGYSSHQCMSVELDSPLGSGGALFEWDLVDGPFYLRHHDLGGWLDRMTKLLEAGAFERHEGTDGPVLRPLEPEDSLPMSELTHHERHPLRWPLDWRLLSGISPAEVEPRGASHTIAELLDRDPARAVEATVAGRVTALAGVGSMMHARVSDAGGSIDIMCPGAVTTLGPVMGGRFEFDVVVLGSEATAAAIRPLD